MAMETRRSVYVSVGSNRVYDIRIPTTFHQNPPILTSVSFPRILRFGFFERCTEATRATETKRSFGSAGRRSFGSAGRRSAVAGCVTFEYRRQKEKQQNLEAVEIGVGGKDEMI